MTGAAFGILFMALVAGIIAFGTATGAVAAIAKVVLFVCLVGFVLIFSRDQPLHG